MPLRILTKWLAPKANLSNLNKDNDNRLLGFGGFGQAGFGGPVSGVYGSPYHSAGFPAGRQSSRGSKLSARIQFFSTTKAGKAFVVFTERARVEDGCSVENFGDILTREKLEREENRGLGRPLGMQGGFGYRPGYGNRLGYSGQLGYGSGFGYGGYGGSFGSMYGMGLGVGAGFGMGSMGLFADDSPLTEDGVVTELDITAGALTSAVVDDVGFDDLSELAGRGLLICSDIEYDWDWNARCIEPTFSCCALKYDNVGLTLVQ
ncbi:hypothetical protein ElyMa_002119800 [Elysia marginata]|uniref:Uncharacterized protein n=1 Tax=Elysia marginata TaxID=1093978 RepID=A0AAV4FH08_9GAST|nr:hypothetical protein ElyMa_002119800 [Elysia marginata]